jgi:hypothetical protein
MRPPVASSVSIQGIDSSPKSPFEARLEAPPPVAEATPLAGVGPELGRAPEIQRAGTAEIAISGEPDVLESRLAATRTWLATEAQNRYSIQLLGTEDATQLKLHLNDLSKFIEMNKIFVYRTLANGRPLLTVLYGSFSDRRSAQEVLNKLPEGLKANRPILRTVEGIRAELKRHQAS